MKADEKSATHRIFVFMCGTMGLHLDSPSKETGHCVL